MKRIERLRGFTLIELMIVVAIIAIIAAIAVPNFLRSRMNANEGAAIAGVKAGCEAQTIYHRTDWDNDGILEFAWLMKGDLSLFETIAGSGDLGLIDEAMADAERQTYLGANLNAIAKQGYLYRIQRDYVDQAGNTQNWYAGGLGTGNLWGFAFYAAPNVYDGSGRNHFSVSHEGVVHQKDIGVWDWGALNVHDVSNNWVVVE